MPHSSARLRLAVALSVAGAACVPAVAQPAASARPNVLLIVSDDQGFSDFGFTGKRPEREDLTRSPVESAPYHFTII